MNTDGPVQRFSDLQLKHKVYILLVLPGVALSLYIARDLFERYTYSDRMEQAAAMADLARYTGDVVHTLQTERGYSSGYLGSGGYRFSTELQSARDLSDAAVSGLEQFLNTARRLPGGEHFQHDMKVARALLASLPNIRRDLDEQGVRPYDLLRYFSVLTHIFIDIIEDHSHPGENDIERLMTMHLEVIRLKEAAGQERGIVNALLAGEPGSYSMMEAWSRAVATQALIADRLHDEFTHWSHQEFDWGQEALLLDPLQSVRQRIMDRHDPGLTPEEWFTLTSARIDYLFGLEKKLKELLSRTAGEEQRTAATNLTLTILGLLLFIGFVFLLHRQISTEITGSVGYVARALREVQEGNLKPDLNHHTGPEFRRLLDDIGTMAAALRQNQKALRQSRESLQQAARMSSLGEMAAGLAHELNNPLAGIEGFIHLLIHKKQSPEKAGRYLEGIYKSTIRMKKLVTHLRSFSRKNHEEDWETFNLRQTLDDSLMLLEQPLDRLKINVLRQVADDLPDVFGNPALMESVLQNFLINSRDAFLHLADGRDKYISIRIEATGDGQIRIVYEDNAGGIPAEALEHVFDPFFTTKEKGKGTGLGLAITKGIITEHKGQIELRNEPGQGVTFTVRLPVARAQRGGTPRSA